MRIGTIVGGVLLLLAAVGPASAQGPPAPDQDQVERLSNLCKVWGTVRYLHPYLAYKDMDWDAALVKALPKVMSAKSTDEYAAAVQMMLDALGDPAMRVMSIAAARPVPPKADKPAKKFYSWINDRTLAVDLRDASRIPPSEYLPLRRELEKARGVILDLRGPPVSDYLLSVAGFNELLPTREARGPAYRFVVHSGYTRRKAAAPSRRLLVGVSERAYR